jgi:hypothetical protein
VTFRSGNQSVPGETRCSSRCACRSDVICVYMVFRLGVRTLFIRRCKGYSKFSTLYGARVHEMRVVRLLLSRSYTKMVRFSDFVFVCKCYEANTPLAAYNFYGMSCWRFICILFTRGYQNCSFPQLAQAWELTSNRCHDSINAIFTKVLREPSACTKMFAVHHLV